MSSSYTYTSDLRVTSPSASTLSKSQSLAAHTVPSTLKTIVTAPPWARDEPPSPTDQLSPSSNSVHPRPSQSALSDSASTSNQTVHRPYGQKDEPLWWMFTRRGRSGGPPHASSSSEKHDWSSMDTKTGSPSEKRPMKERAKSTWLASTHRMRHPKSLEDDAHLQSDDDDDDEHGHRRSSSWGFHIPLPSTPAQITLAQNRTPGWDTPWTARATHSSHGSVDRGNRCGSSSSSREGSLGAGNASDDPPNGLKRTKWYRRRKRIRAFILTNNYVPLLFRVINITLTTAALALAIRIREVEMRYDIMGAIGSSPTLVIIFAPLTLVHVMAAIYLEYFGRPLGLWRTSLKLFHTLSETVFICAWSAALSLCFDNFFTSVIGCAPQSATSWYNEIPREVPDNPNLGRAEGLPGDYICDTQLALICLVFLGLIMYCTNLCISLFRIFEKVKYHQAAALPR